MDKYLETFNTWDKIAALYQEKFMDLKLYDESYDLFCNSIKKEDAKLLEIGCGPGNITKFILSKRPSFQIVGIDISLNMIELAKKNNPNADFEVMDAREIHRLKTRYDAVIAGFCLPYLSQTDCMKLISDCYDLLYPEGFIYLSFVEGEPDQSDFKIGSNGARVYFYFHKLSDLTEQLTNNSFDIIKVFKVEYFKSKEKTDIHTILIAKKIK